MDRVSESNLDTYDAHTILLAGLIYDMREVLAWLLCGLGVVGIFLALFTVSAVGDGQWLAAVLMGVASLYSFGCMWGTHKRRSKYRGLGS